jgi:hypothetical protein
MSVSSLASVDLVSLPNVYLKTFWAFAIMVSLYHEWRPLETKQYLSCTGSWFLILASVFISIRALKLEPTDAQCVQDSFSWSPASDQIAYHWEAFANIDFFTKTPYFGLVPTEEIEDAWNDLLPGMETLTLLLE